MNSFEFTTKKLNEDSAIVWKIGDFTKLQETKGPKIGREEIQFSAGESLGLLSTWSLELHFTTGNAIGLHLCLKQSPKSVKSIYANYSGTVNYLNSSTEWVSLKTAIREYEVDTRWGWKEFLALDKLKAAGILDKDDTLTIHVKMMIYAEELSTPVCSEEKLKQNALNRMSKHFPKVLESGECSDFVIRVKEVESGEYIEKKAHRVILSAQSPVFEAMLGSQMSEKESGVVTIEDLTPKGLDVLLEFIYTGTILDAWKLVPEEIVNAAEKYNLPLLKEFIGERLHEACTPENAFTLYNLSKEHELPEATKHILKYIKSNLQNVLNEI